MNENQRRYRVLAGLSRSRLLDALRRTGTSMSVAELAEAVGLHPNTAREHLDQLVGAGIVVRTVGPPDGRGRPKLRYAVPATDGEEDTSAYRALAAVLATELSLRADTADAAASAGERWGEQLAAGLPPATTATDATDRLVTLLDDAGFAPERPASARDPIALRRCPFRSLARERDDVVCNVHLGLLRGALRQMDAPLDGVELRPFVEEDLCTVQLGGGADA